MEYVLWGLPKGSNDQIDEKVLLVRPSTKHFEECKGIASKDGWHSYKSLTVPCRTSARQCKHEAQTDRAG